MLVLDPSERLCNQSMAMSWSSRPRALVVVAVSTIAAVTGAVSASGSSAPVAADGPAVASISIDAPGPLGPVTLIGDSLFVGASYEPSLPTLLHQQGWGPIRYRAGDGYSAGNFLPAGHEASSANWITWWRQAGWDAPNVVVNLGSNDVGFCGPNVNCNANTIRYLLDRIGPGHMVWWSKITRHPVLAADQAAYNQALDIVAAERGNLRLWDWPSVIAAEGFVLASDGTHLREAVSYRRRSQLMADDITTQLAVGHRIGADAPVPVAAGAATEYLPLAPRRIVDTRQPSGTRLDADGVLQVDLSAAVPAGTRAAAINLTSADPAAAGYLTAYGCGELPSSSTTNYGPGGARGSFAVVPLTAAGRLCVFTSAASDVIVDVQGAFVPDAQRLTTQAPERLADTRATGRVGTLVVSAPAGADAVAVNLTATGSASSGYLSAYPCGGATPEVSNVNFGPGETIAGSAFVPVGDDGTVCVFASTPVDVIVDLTGTFSPAGALAFTPAVPTRVYDTRNAIGGWAPIQGVGQTVDVRAAPDSAVAVTGTLTMVGPPWPGFVTAYGCGALPPTSNVNAASSVTLANSVTVGLAAGGRLCLQTSTMSHVLFDTSGWWAP